MPSLQNLARSSPGPSPADPRPMPSRSSISPAPAFRTRPSPRWRATGHAQRELARHSIADSGLNRLTEGSDDMVEPILKFTRGEYAERLAKTRKAMEAKGIELLIVSDPSNMAWLTGYDGWSFYVHQAVIVPPTGAPVWFGRGQDANGAKRTAYLTPDN